VVGRRSIEGGQSQGKKRTLTTKHSKHTKEKQHTIELIERIDRVIHADDQLAAQWHIEFHRDSVAAMSNSAASSCGRVSAIGKLRYCYQIYMIDYQAIRQDLDLESVAPL
jgi:hypothetical protein